MANLNLIKLKVRRGSNDDRKQVLLQAGEIGYVSDFECKRLVVGDGILLGGRSIAAKFYSGSIEGIWTGQSSFAKALSGDIIFNHNDASLYVLTGAKFEFSLDYYNINAKTDGQTVTATRTGQLTVQQRGISGVQIHDSVFDTDYGFNVGSTGSLLVNNDNISIKLNTEKQLYVDPNDIDWSLLPTADPGDDKLWISSVEANVVRIGEPPFLSDDPDFIVWLQPENLIYNELNDVSRWNDSSSAGNDCVDFPNTTVKGSLNSYPYIGFKSPDGSQTLYAIPNPNRTNDSDRYLSLIAVFQTGNAGNVVNDFIPVNFGDVPLVFGYSRGLSLENSPEGLGMHYQGGSVVIPFGAFPLLPNTWYCFCIIIDEVDETITFYIDGAVIGILTFTNSVSKPKRITGLLNGGASFASMAFENGVAEVLAFNRQLSLEEIGNYQFYLTNKYNI